MQISLKYNQEIEYHLNACQVVDAYTIDTPTTYVYGTGANDHRVCVYFTNKELGCNSRQYFHKWTSPYNIFDTYTMYPTKYS